MSDKNFRTTSLPPVFGSAPSSLTSGTIGGKLAGSKQVRDSQTKDVAQSITIPVRIWHRATMELKPYNIES